MKIEFLYIALGMTTLLVFLFKRKWLFEKQPSLLLLSWNILLFVGGYLLQFAEIGNPKLIVVLKMSLLCQIIFFGLVSVFRKLYKRSPKDTFWTMDLSLMKDGIFNFLFWVIAGVGSAMLVFMKIL